MTQMYSPYPQPQYQPPKKRKKWPWVVGGLATAFVVIGAAGAAGSGGQAPPSTYTSAPVTSSTLPAPVVDLQIPEVAGKNGKIAMDELKNLGFTNATPASQDRNDAWVVLPENWTVVSIQPDVGTTVKSDSTVIVTMTKKKGGVAAPAAPAEPAAPAGSFSDGVYVVGEDIEPGTYKTAGPDSSVFPMCYWARLKDTSGDFASIITNGNPQGQATVTIKSSDGAFETRGCEWTKK